MTAVSMEKITPPYTKKMPRGTELPLRPGKADSIEDAAAAAGLNPAVVTSTVDEYNRLAPHGKDPLGRTSLSSGWGTPQEIKSPPFFIMPAIAAVMGTY